MTSDYREALNKNGMLAFVPGGNSMWPTLKNRHQAVVVIKKEEGKRLKEFDVAIFVRPDGKYVLHRIMEVLPKGYVFLGDSCLEPEFIMEENVLGVMTGFYKGKKFIEVTDKKYIKKVKRWFKRKRYRKFVLKLFFLSRGVKRRLKRLFIKEKY